MDQLRAVNWQQAYANRAAKISASEIREFLKLLDKSDIISFAGGFPDPVLFPRQALRSAFDEALADDAVSASGLQYGATEGYRPLRRWIARRMTKNGVTCDEDNILVTTGSQQALDLLSKLFLSAGDTAIVMEPTYLGALQAFNAYEPRFAVYRPQEQNLDYERDAKSAGSRVRMAYCVSDFSNPSGETLTLEQRKDLLEIVERLGIPLIEDNPYEELRFDDVRVPSISSIAVERNGSLERSPVVYCGSFSKTIAPGLRVGWLCGARDVVRKVVLAKQGADLHTAMLNQIVMHRVVSENFDEHVDMLRTVYARKRDVMLDALARVMPQGVTWTRPSGGLFTFLTFPANVDAGQLLEIALREQRVGFVPGQAFFANSEARNTARLNFSYPSQSAITDGIQRLAEVVRRDLDRRRVACDLTASNHHMQGGLQPQT